MQTSLIHVCDETASSWWLCLFSLAAPVTTLCTLTRAADPDEGPIPLVGDSLCVSSGAAEEKPPRVERTGGLCGRNGSGARDPPRLLPHYALKRAQFVGFMINHDVSEIIVNDATRARPCLMRCTRYWLRVTGRCAVFVRQTAFSHLKKCFAEHQLGECIYFIQLIWFWTFIHFTLY